MSFLDYLAVFILLAVVSNVIGSFLKAFRLADNVSDGIWTSLALGITVILWAARRLYF